MPLPQSEIGNPLDHLAGDQLVRIAALRVAKDILISGVFMSKGIPMLHGVADLVALAEYILWGAGEDDDQEDEPTGDQMEVILDEVLTNSNGGGE